MERLEPEDLISVPRAAVRFPIELKKPANFRQEDPATWPRLPGRMEYVGGRLLLMTPCGFQQQRVSISLAGVLDEWTTAHPEFEAGGNEAGMLLGDETRGADGAIWRTADVDPATRGFVRVPPILAAEIAGLDEDEDDLREKAKWYFRHGVRVVWILLPDPREVLVLHADQERRHRKGESLAANPELPGLTPAVERFFSRLDR